MTARSIRFSIYRYDPDKDSRPRMQDITVALQPTDKMLLDALMRIKSDEDDSLSFRRSCREGIIHAECLWHATVNG